LLLPVEAHLVRLGREEHALVFAIGEFLRVDAARVVAAEVDSLANALRDDGGDAQATGKPH
jgi:hypothetical protein